MEYSLYIFRFAKIEVLRLGTPVTPHDTECLFAPSEAETGKGEKRKRDPEDDDDEDDDEDDD